MFFYHILSDIAPVFQISDGLVMIYNVIGMPFFIEWACLEKGIIKVNICPYFLFIQGKSNKIRTLFLNIEFNTNQTNILVSE